MAVKYVSLFVPCLIIVVYRLRSSSETSPHWPDAEPWWELSNDQSEQIFKGKSYT